MRISIVSFPSQTVVCAQFAKCYEKNGERKNRLVKLSEADIKSFSKEQEYVNTKKKGLKIIQRVPYK